LRLSGLDLHPNGADEASYQTSLLAGDVVALGGMLLAASVVAIVAVTTEK
jgi:hypothetical protein